MMQRKIHAIAPSEALRLLRQVGHLTEAEATEALTKITRMRPDMRGIVIDERAVNKLIGARVLSLKGIR